MFKFFEALGENCSKTFMIKLCIILLYLLLIKILLKQISNTFHVQFVEIFSKFILLHNLKKMLLKFWLKNFVKKNLLKIFIKKLY